MRLRRNRRLTQEGQVPPVIRRLKNLAALNLVSPPGLAVVSFGVFLVAWLFPPGVYTEYMQEPDLMFLDLRSLFYVSWCVAAFIAGTRFFGKTQVEWVQEAKEVEESSNSVFVVLAPVLLLTVLCTYYLFLIGASFDVIGLLASQQGETLKDIAQKGGLSQGYLDMTPTLLTGTLWWASMRASRFSFSASRQRLFNVFYFAGLVVAILTAIARADRGLLIPLLLGSTVTSIYRKTWVKQINPAKVIGQILLSGLAVTILFASVSFFRGSATSRLLIFQFMGYTIVSYNRLAALLGGVMHYAYEGSGVYLVRYLSELSTNNYLSFIPHALGLPATILVWRSEFSSVGDAGLMPGFIWSSIFGYIFSDLGWFAPFYFLGIGTLYGYIWKLFTKRQLLGVVVYPWFAYCILFWFGDNFLFQYALVVLLALTVVLRVYEKLFMDSLRKTAKTSSARLRSAR
jgi:hypothetical protein